MLLAFQSSDLHFDCLTVDSSEPLHERTENFTVSAQQPYEPAPGDTPALQAILGLVGGDSGIIDATVYGSHGHPTGLVLTFDYDENRRTFTEVRQEINDALIAAGITYTAVGQV